jgi:hypothetical protein
MKPHLILNGLATLLCLLLAACSVGNQFPDPKESRLLKGTGGGVMADNRVAKPFSYSIAFSVKSAAPQDTIAAVTFPSPDGACKPKPVKLGPLKPGQQVNASSENFSTIKNNTTYPISICLFADRNQQQLIDTLHQSIRFEMPLPMQRAFGIESHIRP